MKVGYMRSIGFLILVTFLIPGLSFAQWKEQDSGTDTFLSGVFFLDKQHGWITYPDSCLITTNGGLVWQGVPVTSGGRPLSDVAFVGTGIGIVTSNNGEVFRSFDGGVNWGDPKDTQTGGATLLGISYLEDSGSHTWVVGTFEAIAYSYNNGSSWELQHSGSYTLSDVCFVNRDYGWAVGANGTILHTSTGGDSWDPQPSETTEDLHGVWFCGSDTGWVVGGNGLILNTINGGERWSEQNSGTNAALSKVSFCDGNNGVAVGLAGVILHTKDGGTTWVPEDANVNTHLFDVHYENLENCWLVGERGKILYSDGSVSLISPAGGEAWEEGTEQNITWESNYLQSVRIDYSTDNGENWIPVEEQYAAVPGVYTWPVPNTPSDTCRLRIRSSQKPQVEAISGPFEIFQKTITVLKPTMGDTLAGGDNYLIKWVAHSRVDSVDLWLKVKQKRDSVIIAENIDASGFEFDWPVPPGIESDRCRILIFETDGSPIDSSQLFTIVYDPYPPVIELDPTGLQPAKEESLTITAQITDDNPTVNTLFYRQGGDVAFRDKPLEKVEGEANKYQATVFAHEGDEFAIDERGLEFYIRSEDTSPYANGTTFGSEDTPIYLPVTLNTLRHDILRSDPGEDIYQMISIPYKLDATSIGSVLEDDLGPYDPHTWRLWCWSNDNDGYGEYTKEDIGEFTQGKSFWLAAVKDKFFSDEGRSFKPDTFRTDLAQGWNQIGHPFAFPVLTEDVFSASDLPDGINIIYGYSTKWGASALLEPGKGYFIKNPEADTVTLTVPPVAGGSSARFLSRSWNMEDGWSVGLRARAGRSCDDYNIIGAHRAAAVEWDDSDHPEPPPVIGKYISLYFPHNDWGKYPGDYTTDVRPRFQDGQIWHFAVETNVADSEARISFEGVESVPDEFEIVLLDNDLNISQDLRENSDYRFPTFRRGLKKRLMLAIGKPEFFDENNLEPNQIPLHHDLSQNFPNPFHQVTVIRYGLPTSSKVALKIYDVRGEEVAVLLDGEPKDAGYHVEVWNGRDKHGREVSGGVYFCRLKIGASSYTKKMLLIR